MRPLIILLLALAASPLHSQSEVSPERRALEPLFQTTLDYFGKLLRTPNGLYLDSWAATPGKHPNRRCSTAAVGVGLIALCMEHELGRDPKAEQKALQTLLAINGKTKDFQIGRERAGFFRHFFNSTIGGGKSEFSTIDTAILVAGALYCRNTFDDPRITKEADELWSSINWEIALATPRGDRLHMVIDDGKPKPKTITSLFNEYYLLTWLIRKSQIQKTGESNIITFRDLPTWNNDGLTLLTTRYKNPQCSFLIQFPLYMSHPGASDPAYLKFTNAQAQADQRACSQRTGRAHFWGCGAGITPNEGYKASRYDRNRDNVVSPNIIAGFIPAYPEALRHLHRLYQKPKLLIETPHGKLLPRFSADIPDWKPKHIEAIDYSSMLFGLAASHPKLGMKFFQEKTKFTFKNP